ncbi:MAG: GFA family protein [Woeseiaceae bacterium]
MSDFSGSCLCGSVKFEGNNAQGGGHCYCVDCRKSSGSSHCSHLFVAEANVELHGDVQTYDRAADSGNIVSRSFCPKCGSPVYSHNSSMPGMIFIRASSLTDQERFQPGMIVYASRAPSWSRMDPDLATFQEMPPPMDMPETQA